MSESNTVQVGKALSTLQEAAISLEGEDFISYTTIVDIHLTNALKTYPTKDQLTLLVGLQNILEDHEALASDIAWDLIGGLLPFVVQSNDQDQQEEARKDLLSATISLLKFCSCVGNPKEVFMTVTGKLGSLEFRNSAVKDEFLEDDDETEEADFNHSKDAVSSQTKEGSLKQASVLMELLFTIQPRIRAKTPSKFLTTSLLSILGMFTRASRKSTTKELSELLSLITKFISQVVPNTITSQEIPSDIEAKEPLLQKKLLQAFVTHIVEGFFTSQSGVGRYVGWASNYDRARRPERYPPAAIRPSVAEHEHQHELSGTIHDHSGIPVSLNDDRNADKLAIEMFLRLSKAVDIEVDELYVACQKEETLEVKQGEEEEDAIPTSSEQIDLSPTGSLLLLSILLSETTYSEATKILPKLQLFPDHANLTKIFLSSEAREPVQDAMLFLGTWILRHDTSRTPSLGDVPKVDYDFYIYLQVYGALSAMSSNPEIRFAAHSQVQASIQLQSREEARIGYFKDTLEYCPFDELKSVTVQLLKDEILSALKVYNDRKGAAPATESLFLTPFILQFLAEDLFPDYSNAYTDTDLRIAWTNFRERHSTMTTTAKLYYILLRNDTLRKKLDINNIRITFTKDIPSNGTLDIGKRWTDVIRNAIERFSAALDERDDELELETEDEYIVAKFELELLNEALKDVRI